MFKENTKQGNDMKSILKSTMVDHYICHLYEVDEHKAIFSRWWKILDAETIYTLRYNPTLKKCVLTHYDKDKSGAVGQEDKQFIDPKLGMAIIKRFQFLLNNNDDQDVIDYYLHGICKMIFLDFLGDMPYETDYQKQFLEI